jgi:hypothetical protein
MRVSSFFDGMMAVPVTEKQAKIVVFPVRAE